MHAGRLWRAGWCVSIGTSPGRSSSPSSWPWQEALRHPLPCGGLGPTGQTDHNILDCQDCILYWGHSQKTLCCDDIRSSECIKWFHDRLWWLHILNFLEKYQIFVVGFLLCSLLVYLIGSLARTPGQPSLHRLGGVLACRRRNKVGVLDGYYTWANICSKYSFGTNIPYLGNIRNFFFEYWGF